LGAHLKRLLTIKEIVAEYGVTAWFWSTQIWEGRLPAININGRKQLVDRADIEKFINKNKF
jgi:hypothetical protein